MQKEVIVNGSDKQTIWKLQDTWDQFVFLLGYFFVLEFLFGFLVIFIELLAV
jgi:hypothetical protein